MHKLLLTTIAVAIGRALAVSGCRHISQRRDPPGGASMAQPIAFDVDNQSNPGNDFANYANAKWNKVKTPADIADFIDTSYSNGDSYVFSYSSGADFTTKKKALDKWADGDDTLVTIW